MSKKISPVPKGYRTITPQIVVNDANAAAAYYEAIFDAKIISRQLGDDGVSVLQLEIQIGNSIIRLMDEMPNFGIHSPLTYGGTSVGLHLYLPDADRVWACAIENGAGVILPFAEMPWGEEYGKLIDPFGHVWSISRRISTPNAQNASSKKKAEIKEINIGFSVHEPMADQLEPSAEHEMVNYSSQEK